MYNLLDDEKEKKYPAPQKHAGATVHSKERSSMSKHAPRTGKKPLSPKAKRIIGYTLITLSVVLFVGYFLIFVPAVRAYQQAIVVADNLRVLAAHGKDQNIIGIQESIPKTKAEVEKLKKEAGALAWTKFIPFAGAYYRDFEHGTTAANAGLDAAAKMVDVISPYADLLGLRGKSNFTGSTQDRIARLVDTMDKIIPEVDAIKPQLTIVKNEMNQINPDRYAFSEKIQTELTQAIEQVNAAEDFINESKPFLEVLPQFLGRDKPTNYIIIFQNDKELRASGGFLTAYARLAVDKGRILSPPESADMYRIDEKLPIKVTPPDQILKYLPEPNGKVKTHLQTRDSNYLPDFKETAQQFEWFYSYVKPIDWDGVVAVDTHVVTGLVSLLGSVEVNGIKFTAENDKRCNCPNVVYELENYAQRSAAGNSERKALIGDLMQEILLQIFKNESKIPALANEAIRLMNDRHVQIYMHDQKMQEAMEHLDWAGRIASVDNPTKFRYEEGKWDYWYWNESNYAGQKANLYIKQTSEHDYSVASDGTITKTVNVTVSNPQKNDWWLNGKYRAYFRAFVPQGSQLLESKGSRDPVQAFSQYGKTVFDGFFELMPQQNPPVKITLKYKLPFKASGDTLNALFQKQPGTTQFQYSLKGIGEKQEFDLSIDRKVQFSL